MKAKEIGIFRANITDTYELKVEKNTSPPFPCGRFSKLIFLCNKEVEYEYNVRNDDRLYGFCEAIVDTLRRLGINISMPNELVDMYDHPYYKKRAVSVSQFDSCIKYKEETPVFHDSYRIYVRWNSHGKWRDTVELLYNQEIVQVSDVIKTSNDRSYGYCKGLVFMLKLMGKDVEMPSCLTGRRITANRCKEY